MLRLVAHREQFDVIVVVECDRVVRAFAGMRAAGADVEAELLELCNARIEIGHANRYMVDACEHSCSSAQIF
jgi:hypothetical protein